MTCEFSELTLHGYLDGELDAIRCAEFERHVRSCADCGAALDKQESLRAALKNARLREPSPPALRARVLASLPASAAQPSFLPRLGLRWVAIAAVCVFALFLSWRALLPPEPLTGPAIEQVVDAHLRSLQPGHLNDVTSSDQHTVKPWFDGRLDFAPPVADLSSAGFPLAGGRIDVLNGRTVAALVYGRRKHWINVFVWPAQGPDRSLGSGSTLGYAWVRWRAGGMEFWAVSDTAAGDLRELENLLSP